MIFYSLRLLLQSAFHFESCFYLLWFYLCLRSSHKPVFVRMTPLQSDWSLMGLKGIIPSLLHHTLLGYNFLIPDAVGNTTAYGSFFSPLLRTYCSCDWWAQKHEKSSCTFTVCSLKNYGVGTILRDLLSTFIVCSYVGTKKEDNSWLWNSFKLKKTFYLVVKEEKHPNVLCIPAIFHIPVIADHSQSDSWCLWYSSLLWCRENRKLSALQTEFVVSCNLSPRVYRPPQIKKELACGVFSIQSKHKEN